MKAVHFGAGNIGRGFVGELLHESGYEVVFADVSDALIDALDAADSYTVTEIGEGGRTSVVTDFRAINSRTDEARLVDEIATADVVTTAVGPRVLPFIAPVIARGIERRIEIGEDAIEGRRIAVFACENAINATDLLEAEVRAALPEADADRLDAVAAFANTAIDRIVPAQAPDAGLDVVLEPFHEWVIDRTPFGGEPPEIVGVHWVDDLAPFIERKLFTVNTGHATAAYHGFARGIRSITDAITDPAIRSEVEAAIGETRSLLVAKFGLDEAEQAAYGRKILDRLSNPELPDTVERVGRGPLRKLSRAERFIGPASQLAERGLPHEALLRGVAVALRFDVPEDPESVELQRILREEEPDGAVTVVTGVEPGHPLFAELLELFQGASSR
ncbi:mannitol-1-phosphate 5-dehydrogenase [Amnibacterium setariae]|uniref:Mannitol-1-phosphate 5-dehydrogenase n=1 Tax=Amnibacterium setariae TaxID=2306585 RepID=A0A3A1U4C6_9MICO|nr:mannitol-1-phosphate 5-dehydrogenase [Amnibacterium setariae]RIX28697.1 mannitol-1-phosphate 5-dehydrogenase [Amnibacterium setariae]